MQKILSRRRRRSTRSTSWPCSRWASTRTCSRRRNAGGANRCNGGRSCCCSSASSIKVPSVPFHTWLPDAHVEAPTPISMILAGVLLKMGGYGIIRICYPICPQAGFDLAYVVCGIGVVSMVYGAFAAMAQTDFKRLVAYSSVSHMGYVVLGLGVWSAVAGTNYNPDYWEMGMNGAMFQMIAHGISSAGMFFMVGVVYDRVHHRNLRSDPNRPGRVSAAAERSRCILRRFPSVVFFHAGASGGRGSRRQSAEHQYLRRRRSAETSPAFSVQTVAVTSPGIQSGSVALAGAAPRISAPAVFPADMPALPLPTTELPSAPEPSPLPPQDSWTDESTPLPAAGRGSRGLRASLSEAPEPRAGGFCRPTGQSVATSGFDLRRLGRNQAIAAVGVVAVGIWLLIWLIRSPGPDAAPQTRSAPRRLFRQLRLPRRQQHLTRQPQTSFESR